MSKSKSNATNPKACATSSFVSSRVVKITPEEAAKLNGPLQNAKLLFDHEDRPERYASLSENEYLDVVFNEMKTIFIEQHFEDDMITLVVIDGNELIKTKGMRWPVAPSAPSQLRDRENRIPLSGILWPTEQFQSYNTTNINVKSETDLHIPHHKMIARYGGSFHINNAIIRAKFVGDDNRHTFAIRKYEMVSATVFIGSLNVGDERPTQAFLMDWCYPPQPVYAELEEYTIFAVTDGRYYKNHVKPREISEDVVVFTCFNKARGLYCDTVASFKNGLCDPEDIFDGSASLDVPAK